MSLRHFLQVSDFGVGELQALIGRARDLKALYAVDRSYQPLVGRTLAMVFDKSSTRTRVSFEAGMLQLGGNAIFLSAGDSQLGRGEPMEDTARVLSRMVDAIMIRTGSHGALERFAAHSSVPVINGLSDVAHPCQLLADWLTFEEHRGPLADRTVAWIGDGNNMCLTYIAAAAHLGFHLRIASPEGFEPLTGGARLPPCVTVMRDPREAVRGAHLVLTDVWISMGQEAEREARMKAFSGYRVDRGLLDLAALRFQPAESLAQRAILANRGAEACAVALDPARRARLEPRVRIFPARVEPGTRTTDRRGGRGKSRSTTTTRGE